MRISVDPGAYAPVRGHKEDAGIDIKSMYNHDVPPRGSVVCLTGTHVEIPEGYCGLLVSKSGLNVTEDLTTTGLIDHAYSGQILVKVYNHGTKTRHIAAGQKITQLVVIPCLTDEIEIVDKIEGGERGASGFGSSGKF